MNLKFRKNVERYQSVCLKFIQPDQFQSSLEVDVCKHPKGRPIHVSAVVTILEIYCTRIAQICHLIYGISTQNISNTSVFSLNCQIAVQKYIDYYPAFEMSRECKFIKVMYPHDHHIMILNQFSHEQFHCKHPIFVCSYFALRWNRKMRRASW